MEGLQDYDGDSESGSGVLGVFRTSDLAVRVGEAWADLQFKTRVYDNSQWKTEEEKEETLDEWSRDGDSHFDGYWRYNIYCRSDSLTVAVDEMDVMTEFEGLEDEEEDEDSDEDEQGDEEGNNKEGDRGDESGEEGEDGGKEGEHGGEKGEDDDEEEEVKEGQKQIDEA